MFRTKFHIDVAYAKRIGMSLDRFREVKRDTFNARCPFCGDSKRSKRVARFYIYTKKGSLNTICHNCGYSRSFFNFVSDFAPELYDEYKKETLFDSFKRPEKRKKADEDVSSTLGQVGREKLASMTTDARTLEKLSVPCIELPDTHPAIKYLKSRGFQRREIKRLLYTDDFQAYAEQINEEAAAKLVENEPRIIIPFYEVDGDISMVQGRSLNPKSRLKYISVKTHDDVDKIYGKYELDTSKTSYCVEGPFDSLFVDNCIATCDSSLARSDADVLIWDNQPRSKEIIDKMKEAIDAGRRLVIWPNSPAKKQDINDLILSGVNRKVLMQVIRQRTYKGLMAVMKLNEWKRI